MLKILYIFYVSNVYKRDARDVFAFSSLLSSHHCLVLSTNVTIDTKTKTRRLYNEVKTTPKVSFN